MEPPKILDVQSVTVSFDGFKVLDGLNFSMNYGELRFLIGPNGAGKTTLLDIMTGKTRPQSGKVIFDRTVDAMKWPDFNLVQQGIGRKFQTPTIFPSLTVFENLEAAVSLKDGAFRLFQKMGSGQRTSIEEMLVKTGLKDRATFRAGSLSHGEKQWLEIGMLLIQEPKLLLLDEPVAGMTRQERTRTGEMLQEISRERTVLVVEHDMEFVRTFAKTVSVLHTGKLLCEGPMDQVQSDPRVIEVYLGHANERGKPAAHASAEKSLPS